MGGWTWKAMIEPLSTLQQHQTGTLRGNPWENKGV